MVTRLLLVLSILLIACALPLAEAAAQDERPLSVRRAMAKAEESMKTAQVSASRQCGADFAFAFDWRGFSNDDLKEKRAASYCEAAFSALRQVCYDELGSEAVRARVEGLVCGFSENRLVSLEEGILRFDLNFTDSNNQDFVRSFLEDAL